MCDQVFPERRGWFREYYEESKTWTPPGFKDWREHEDKATALRDWWPSIITGLGQTEDYARALLGTSLGATEEIIAARLAARMDRQRRLLAREVQAWFIVDQLALYRLVGSPEVMAVQMRRLAEIAALPHATVQVLPAVAHPANASGLHRHRRRRALRARQRRHSSTPTSKPFLPGQAVRYPSGRVLPRVRVPGTAKGSRRTMDWRKSTYSDANGGACVETASNNGQDPHPRHHQPQRRNPHRHHPRLARLHPPPAISRQHRRPANPSRTTRSSRVGRPLIFP